MGAPLLIGRKPGGLFLSLVLRGNCYTRDWSFYVWYMDKNRPLPPGTALDPYRERDEERRKREGCPLPLYPDLRDQFKMTEWTYVD